VVAGAQADQMMEDAKKIKQVMLIEDFKRSADRLADVSTFDGFRLVVMRNINMNAAVQHMFWLGTTMLPSGASSMYNYTTILGDERSSLQLTADPSLNINGEARTLLSPEWTAKLAYSLAAEAPNNVVFLDLDYTGETMTTSFRAGYQGGATLQAGFMQAITPQLVVGAQGAMQPSKGVMTQAFCGRYESDDFGVTAVVDGRTVNLNYIRKVNPNRVNLTADLKMDLTAASSAATLGAEFQLAQSRLHMSIDSNAMIKSTVETKINPRMQLQLSAEMYHPKDHYKFGYGLMVNN